MKRTLIFLLVLSCTFLAKAQLTPVNNFGSNPGNLNMFLYEPSGMPANAPVVLVMHGCTQNASTYANESGWNSLADDFKFYVIYADQPSANNSSNCFNWFENADQNRGFGEPASLKSMVDYMKANFSVDNNRVFVTGFSAGGAMTTVMLAAYPEVFSSGAIMAGLPYDVATGTTQAFQAMFGNVNLSPNQLGNRVRNASSFTGPWPTVAVFHGGSDFIVYTVNEREVMEQWTNVHGIDQTPELDDPSFLGIANVRKREYRDGSGDTKVVTYSFNGMGHAIAVDPGSGPTQGGSTGSYATDVNFWSSYYSAEFFGLLNTAPSLNPPTNINASATSSSQINVSWTDNETTETGYQVERATNASGPFTVVANLGANASSYSDTGLSQLTTYFYRVSVTDGSNTVAGTIVSETTPSDGTPTLPTAPSNLNAVATGQTSIDLSWNDNANNEDAFIVERSTGNESNYAVIATLAKNTTTFSDQGLTSATTYFYRVKAQNSVGDSPFSASASTTTDSPTTLVTIEQTAGTGALSFLNFNDMGQSFTPNFDGDVVSIAVNLVNAISGSSLRIFQGNTVSGTPIYEQTGITAGSGWQTITLTNPQAITDGQQYTFQLTDASIRYNFSNVYPGGNFWYNNISYTVFDAAFIITASTSTGARPATDIPVNQLQDISTDLAEVGIYPNPSSGAITVDLRHGSTQNQIEVFSMDGKRIIDIETQNDSERLDLSSYGKGIYQMKISTEDQSFYKRVIIK
ncbi:MAG: PHB depolymerase family esterase [Bacteroidota bacterium]